MNAFKKLWRRSIFYETYDVISSTYYYIKDKNFVSDTLYSEAFNLVLRKYLNVPTVSKDWLGRLYCIVNPNINISGDFDFNNVIIEIDGDNTNNNEYVKNWVYKQMALIASLFKIEKLYDYINIEFNHVGPIEADNYLVIFDIVSRQLMTSAWKRFLLHSIILGVIAFFIVTVCTI